MSLLSELRSAGLLGITSAPRRAYASASVVVAIALTTLVLLGFLSVGKGYKAVLAGAGSPDVAVVLSADATSARDSSISPEQVAMLSGAPGIRKAADGRALMSAEVVVPVSLMRRSDAQAANLMMRGMNVDGELARKGITVTSGRLPTAGAPEIIVGVRAAEEFRGLDVGSTIRLGGLAWNVVGRFDAGGSILESEVRADLHVVQPVFHRGLAVQSVRVEAMPEDLPMLQRFLTAEPSHLHVEGEIDYFRKLSEQSGTFLAKLAWPLAIVMALGALAGAGNAMYASIEARSGEIVTLRVLGFGRAGIFLGVLVESASLSLIGCALGALIAWLVFDGMRGATMGGSFGQVMFLYQVSGSMILDALVFCLLVGVVGAMLPALKASRLPLVLAGRE